MDKLASTVLVSALHDMVSVEEIVVETVDESVAVSVRVSDTVSLQVSVTVLDLPGVIVS